jgi:hypothetical protein
MQAFRRLYHELEAYGCDLRTMPVEMGTEDEVLYATDYLRQRVRSLAQDALQRKDLSAHEHWISVLRPAKKISTDNTIKKCVP